MIMADQIIDKRTVAIPGPIGDVTPAAMAARDSAVAARTGAESARDLAEAYAAEGGAKADQALSGLILDPKSSTGRMLDGRFMLLGDATPISAGTITYNGSESYTIPAGARHDMKANSVAASSTNYALDSRGNLLMTAPGLYLISIRIFLNTGWSSLMLQIIDDNASNVIWTGALISTNNSKASMSLSNLPLYFSSSASVGMKVLNTDKSNNSTTISRSESAYISAVYAGSKVIS
jgi:hypothetical protein